MFVERALTLTRRGGRIGLVLPERSRPLQRPGLECHRQVRRNGRCQLPRRGVAFLLPAVAQAVNEHLSAYLEENPIVGYNKLRTACTFKAG